jgi:hypothetical protein
MKHIHGYFLLYAFNNMRNLSINFRSGRESDSDIEVEHAEKLRQVRAVLEEVK